MIKQREATILASVRDFLATRDTALDFARQFGELVVAEREARFAGTELDDPSLKEVTAYAIRTLYPHAIETVYNQAESPIESLFVGSLVISFMLGDPLGLLVRPPFSDAPRQMNRAKSLLGSMLEAEGKLREARRLDISFTDYLDYLESEQLISVNEHAFSQQWYLLAHVLGYYNAFHLSMQARFPSVKVDGRAIRADLLIYVPGSDLRLVVECDGYEWHSSRKMFTTDRQRDRALKSAGFETFRFSGSEIRDNPVAASKELFDYLQSKVNPSVFGSHRAAS